MATIVVGHLTLLFHIFTLFYCIYLDSIEHKHTGIVI